MLNIKGVDLSYCQQGIDYDALVRAGVRYAILRACYNIYKDNLLDKHIKGCKKAGIDIGFYVYSTAKTPDEARREAEACIAILDQYDKPTYPVFYDLEEPNIAQSVDRATLTDCAIAFCKTMQEHGYYSGIYTNPSWMLNYYQKDRLIGKFDIWLAHWTDNPEKPSNYDFGQTMWQWGVDYIDMKVDGDICFIDYPAKIKSWLDAQANNGETPEPDDIKPTPEPEPEPEAPVIPEEPAKYPAGMQVNMDNTAIYISSDAKKPANHLSGTYYIQSEQIINNRIRITTPKDNTDCTGWVNTSDIDALKGNTITAKPSKAQNKELDAIAYQVIRGLYGCGATRIRLLTRAGYDYAKVQARVDELLRR